MITDNIIPELNKKIKEFETNKDIIPFIENNLFNSDSELFYTSASSELQIFIFEMIFLLELLVENFNVVFIKEFNLLNYELVKLEEQDYQYILKTNNCNVLF